MNAVEYDYSVLPTSDESAAYSALIAEVVKTGERLSDVQFVVTVEYSSLQQTTTYRCRNAHYASRIIARSKDFPVSWRVALKPEIQVERAATRHQLPRSLAEAIQEDKRVWS